MTDVAVDAIYILDEDAMQQQSDGQAGSSQIVASQEAETVQIRLPRYARYFYMDLASIFLFSEMHDMIYDIATNV